MRSQITKRMNINLTKTEETVIEELLKQQEIINEWMGNPPDKKNNASDIVRLAIDKLGYALGLGDKM